ncbi:MAG: FAD binding domain-containing protein [Dermatophilaceae bacterium]
MTGGRSAPVEFRAGGTDVSERRRSGVTRGPVVELTSRPGPQGISIDADGGSLDALCTMTDLAGHAGLVAGYPGLAATAGALATPQVRAMATLGGNLAQHTRCWYYRNPAFSCLRRPGGSGCPAREGNHLHGVAFDRGGCVWPHPSSVAAALLAYRAEIEVDRVDGRIETMATGVLYDPAGARDHALSPGERILRVLLPPAVPGERAGYFRAISREHAEWPLVEAVVAVTVDGGRGSHAPARSAGPARRLTTARVGLGGIANTPMSAEPIEERLVGLAPDDEAAVVGAVEAGLRALSDAPSLRDTAYKRALVAPTVAAALRRAVGSGTG